VGDIIEKRMRHYVGLDADKASIPAGGKSKGDSYHANDKGKQYYWNGANWKTGLGYEYVPLLKAAWDWDITDLTDDGAWKVNALDASAKGVVVGATGIVTVGFIRGNAASLNAALRHSAGAHISGCDLYTQVANVYMYYQCVMPIDSDLLFDYLAVAAIDAFNIAITGYFI